MTWSNICILVSLIMKKFVSKVLDTLVDILFSFPSERLIVQALVKTKEWFSCEIKLLL